MFRSLVFVLVMLICGFGYATEAPTDSASPFSTENSDQPSSTEQQNTDTAINPYQHTSLRRPIYSDKELLKWARTTIVAPCNYSYQNYDEAHAEAREYFSPKAWSRVQNLLSCHGERDRFIKRKSTLQCIMTGNLQIIRKGTRKGRYAWHVAAPMRIVSLGHSASSVITSMLITRTNAKSAKDGLMIKRYYITINSVS